MDGHIEILTAMLRIGGKYGDPYWWVCTLRFIAPYEAEVVSPSKANLTTDEWREIRSVMQQLGLIYVFYYRIKAGKKRLHVVYDHRNRSKEDGTFSTGSTY